MSTSTAAAGTPAPAAEAPRAGEEDCAAVEEVDAINNLRRTPAGATDLMAWCRAQPLADDAYVVKHVEDPLEIRDWRWQRPNG